MVAAARGFAPVAALAFGLGLVGGHGRAAAVPAAADAVGLAAGTSAEWRPLLGGFGWLADAVAFSDTDVWAVGDGIVHYDGEVWRQLSDHERPGYRAIDGFSADALWVAGERFRGECDSGGFILRKEGALWRQEPIDTHQPLYDIQMLAPDDGWAVGGIDTPAILHYDGTAWRSVGAPETAGLRALHMLDRDTGFAVGADGAIVRYNGRFWQQQASPTTSTLWGVHMLDATFGWAVGHETGYRYGPGAGTILVYEDGRWWRDPLPTADALADVHTLSRDRALAVGAHGVLLRFDGTWWREVGRTYPGATPYGPPEAGAAPDAAGAPTAAPRRRLADATARDVIPPAQAPMGGAYDMPSRGPGTGMLHRLAPLPDGETLLAVGDGGQVVVVEDRDWWEAHAGRDFTALDALAPDDVWVVGNDGPPLHWDGTTWRAHPTPRRAYRLADIDAVSADDAWAVGPAGTIAHWDGAAWTMWPRFTTVDLATVSFGAADDGWAIGTRYDADIRYESFVFRYDGREWRQALHLCGTYLDDVLADGDGGAWLAARDMALLRLDGRDWQWLPVPGLDDPGGPAPRVGRLVAGEGDRVWGLGMRQGIAALEGGTWRTVQPDAPNFYGYYPSLRGAGAGSGRLWLLDWAWSETDWFQRQALAQLRLVEPGRSDRLAYRASPQLADLVSLPLPDGGQEVWAAGPASTVLRYRTTAPPASLPEPTATAAVSPPRLEATPTPRAIAPEADVRRAVLDTVDPDVTGEVTLERLELLSEAGARAAADALWSDPDVRVLGGISWGSRCEPGWRPVWLAVAGGRPRCPMYGPSQVAVSHVMLRLDAADAHVEDILCFSRSSHRLHLPVALGGIVTAPRPTATARDLTPVAAADHPGPCPTVTPYDPGAGYP